MFLSQEQIKYIREAVGEGMGFASLSWNPRPIGVYDSTECISKLNEAVAKIIDRVDYPAACQFFLINGNVGRNLEDLMFNEPPEVLLHSAIERSVNIAGQSRETASKAAAVIKNHWALIHAKTSTT